MVTELNPPSIYPGSESWTEVPARVHHERAKALFSADALAHIDGVAGEGRTARRNLAAFDRFELTQRVLRESFEAETSITCLGVDLPTPVAVAPIGSYDRAVSDGSERVARGAGEIGSFLFVSQAARYEPSWWREQSSAPLCLIGYRSEDLSELSDLFDEAEDAGFSAVGITVDSPAPQQIGYRVPRSGDGSERSGRPVTPKDLSTLRERTRLPFVVKGVMTPEDAEIAVSCGADAVVVSNHGGRVLDGSASSLDALPRVVERVQGQTEVFFDGGVRRGTDVAVAIAHGADLVLVGRPVAWAMASGSEAVAGFLQHLTSELERVLIMTGTSDVSRLDAAVLELSEAPAHLLTGRF